MTAIATPTEKSAIERPLIRQLGIDTQYVLVGFPLGIVSFVVLLTGFALGVGLVVLTVGLLILAGTLVLARGLAWVERARMPAVLREAYVPVRYRYAPPEASVTRRLLTPLTDGQRWLDFAYGLLRFPLNTATFVIVVTWWVAALAGLTYPLYSWSIPYGPDNTDLPELLGLGDSSNVRNTFYVILGAVVTITLPYVVRFCALLDAWTARAMLTTLPRLRAEVAGLANQAQTATSRTAAAVSAEATALRRLERDIHDGPQQRLVRLAVDLGRAQQQLETDPAMARTTVDEAIVQARETLDELRTLSRGIAPPILTDRGLAAAVAALAARATVPVELDIPELGRLDPLTEQTAYFAIAEALTNLAKHSGARRGTVSVARAADRLTVTITDDGRGGAQLAKGHGLAGLADRLHSAGGELWVSSPDGGPTKIRAELPCPTVD